MKKKVDIKPPKTEVDEKVIVLNNLVDLKMQVNNIKRTNEDFPFYFLINLDKIDSSLQVYAKNYDETVKKLQQKHEIFNAEGMLKRDVITEDEALKQENAKKFNEYEQEVHALLQTVIKDYKFPFKKMEDINFPPQFKIKPYLFDLLKFLCG